MVGIAPQVAASLDKPPEGGSEGYLPFAPEQYKTGTDYIGALVSMAAPSALPPGFSVRQTSGYRPGATVEGTGAPSQHAGANAGDFEIIAPNGTPIPNKGPDITGLYGKLKDEVFARADPRVAKLMRWGGTFTTTGLPGAPADLMHFDLRGGGSPASTPAPGVQLASLATGPFNASAQSILGQWQQDIQKRGKEYDTALADAKDLRTASRAALDKWAQQSEKPPQNMREAWSQFIAPATVLALIGGMMGRNVTASVNAAGMMLQAANKADTDAYERSYRQWRDHLSDGLKLAELLNSEANDIVNDARKSYDQKVSELQTLSVAYSLEQHLDPHSVENMTKNIALMSAKSDLIRAQNADTEIKLAVSDMDKKWLESHPEANGVVPPSVHLEHEGQAKRTSAGTSYRPTQPTQMRVTGPDGKVVREGAAYIDAANQPRWLGSNEPVIAPDGGKVDVLGRTGVTGEPITDETAKRLAEAWLSGDRSAAQGFGYGRTGAENKAKVLNWVGKIAEERGLHGDEIAARQAEFAGRRAEFQAVGRRQAGIQVAGAEARRLIPQVLKTSEAVDRTEFSDINNILLAGERRTGDPNVVRFGIAINSFINTYARALSPTGVATVSDKDHARDLLQTGWSKGQIQAGIDQLTIELNAALEAPDDVWKNIIATMTEDKPRGPEFLKETKGSGSSQSGGERIPVPPAYASDPDDTPYRKDGVVWIKRGDHLERQP